MVEDDDRMGMGSGTTWTLDDDGRPVRIGEVPERYRRMRERQRRQPARERDVDGRVIERDG